ncbi:MAG: hypothetical protein FJ279_25905 [Planctomycetes bacterium]|nr:hypothetical protein [Planctomycetota bacterium]MBM4080226.1 hypothetical protein [Planctomycetota bacterium]
MHPPAPLSLVMVFSFLLAGVSYFYAGRSRWCVALTVLLALAFFASASASLWLVLGERHAGWAILSITLLAGVPLAALVIFAVDVAWGLFCTEMTYAVVVAWLLGLMLLLLNLVFLAVGCS